MPFLHEARANTNSCQLLASPGAVDFMTARPVRVVINGRFLTQTVTGVQRTARELVRAIDQLLISGEVDDASHRFVILAPRHATQHLDLACIRVQHVGRMRGHVWEQFELPFHARGNLLLSFANAGPLAANWQVVTIHDAAVFAVPQAFSWAFRTWYRLLLPRLARRARMVLTVSSFSLQELARLAGIPVQHMQVVPLGREHILEVAPDPTVLARHHLDDRPFVLVVGSRSPHKNFQAVTRAIESLGTVPYDFVVAGGANTRVFGTVSDTTTGRAKEIGYVTDNALRALYERAACLVFPSLYEGFGLPPLEAMACGCPVIVARAASLPEVCGDAAMYFDPHDPTDLAARIAEMMDSASLRHEFARRGRERARRFSWAQSARLLIELLDRLD